MPTSAKKEHWQQPASVNADRRTERRLPLPDEQNDFGDHHRRFPSIDFC
jgi:hypothetical protein